MPSLPPWLRQVISITALTLVVLFSARACAIDAAQVEVQFRLGSEYAKVARIEAHLFDDEKEPISSAVIDTTQSRTPTVGSWQIPSLATGDYPMEIRVKGTNGKAINLVRTLTVASDRAVIEVVLQNSLAALADK